MPSERTKNPGESGEESAGLSASQILGVLDHLEDCLMVVDTAGILRYWNESSSERFGTPDFPALGRPFSGLVHPEDSPEIIEAMEFFFEKGSPPPKTGEPEVGLRIRDAEGFWLACIARLRVIRPSGDTDPLCLLSVREDRERRRIEPWREKVQELKEEVEAKSRKLAESEADYRSLIETMNDGFWVLDAQGRILFANEKMAQLLGYGVSDLVGSSAFELFDESNCEIFVKQIDNRMEGKYGEL